MKILIEIYFKFICIPEDVACGQELFFFIKSKIMVHLSIGYKNMLVFMLFRLMWMAVLKVISPQVDSTLYQNRIQETFVAIKGGYGEIIGLGVESPLFCFFEKLWYQPNLEINK